MLRGLRGVETVGVADVAMLPYPIIQPKQSA